MAQVERARRSLSGVWIALVLLAIASVLIVLPLTTAVIVVGGALALVAVLRWPELALYALIFAVPYGSLLPFSVSVGNVTAVDLLTAAVLALWLTRMIVQDRAIRIYWPPLSLPFALFLGVALISTLGALSLQSAAKEWTKWAEMFAIYVYAANTLDTAKMRRALLMLFIAGISEAAIGIYQFTFRVGPDGFALFGRFMRAYGTFDQPNPYAGYLALIIPVALGVVTAVASQKSSRERGGTSAALRKVKSQNGAEPSVNREQLAVNRERSRGLLLTVDWRLLTDYGFLFAAAIALAVMLTALLMSWSRGAWLGVGAALVVVVVVQSRRAFVLSVIAAFVLTVVILLSSINIIPNAIAERFAGVGDYFGVFDVRGVKVDDSNYAIVERMAHWQAAIEMWAARPLLGVGFGNYAAAYPAYALPLWSDPLGHAHNYYLNVAAEAGTLGAVAFGLLWGAVFWQAWRTVHNTRGMEHPIAAGLLGMIVALMIHNGFDNLFVHGMAVQVGIGLGMLAAMAREFPAEALH